jgi:hypothetical protein
MGLHVVAFVSKRILSFVHSWRDQPCLSDELWVFKRMKTVGDSTEHSVAIGIADVGGSKPPENIPNAQ